MPIKVQLTTTPVDEKGKPEKFHDIEEAEFIDLSRMGLIVPDSGDINAKGDIKKTVEASEEARTATGQQPVLTREV